MWLWLPDLSSVKELEMQNVLNFIKTYWRECLSTLTILIALISYIVEIIKLKKRYKNGEINLNTFTNTMIDLISE